MARRRGVIARLPKKVREMLNLKLQDGITYRVIGEWLQTQGHPGITEIHVRTWYQGGYADWQREQSELQVERTREEFAQEFVEGANETTLQEAGLQMAAARCFEAFRQLDVTELQEAMKEKPEVYVRLLNGLVRMTRGRIELERFKRERMSEGRTTLLTPAEQHRRMREIMGIDQPSLLDEPEYQVEGGDGI